MIEAICIIAIVLIFCALAFPFALGCLSFMLKSSEPDFRQMPQGHEEGWPLISILIPAHKKASILKEKLTDIYKSSYPNKRMEILVLLDGDVQGAHQAIEKYKSSVSDGPALRMIQCPRAGKNKTLSIGARQAKGSIFLFTDQDARLDKQAITRLAGALEPQDIGGGCGRHLILSSPGTQTRYWEMESWIKSSEMKLLGKITASYGTICAIKREFFNTIPPGVTDDHYLCLLVVEKGSRFVYVPEAKVYIEKPSKDLQDEIKRKHRITAQSLCSLWLRRSLLNPFKWSWYSVCLWCHKVIRRLMPIFAVIIFISCFLLSIKGLAAAFCFLLLQLVFYLLAITALLLGRSGKKTPRLLRMPGFFLAGNIGMLYGIIDFLQGKKSIIW